MPDDIHDLTTLLARGFSGVSDQMRERDQEVRKLSESFIRLEGEVKNMAAAIVRVENDLARAENAATAQRVGVLEKRVEEYEKQQKANAIWLRGLLVSMILLLLGFILNFIRISAK